MSKKKYKTAYYYGNGMYVGLKQPPKEINADGTKKGYIITATDFTDQTKVIKVKQINEKKQTHCGCQFLCFCVLITN